MTPTRFPFLDARVVHPRAPRPVNVFEISGFPRWEIVASNVLAFFLDPNERHRFGTAFVDGLLTLLDGRRLVGYDETFSAAEHRGSAEWTVVTERATADGMRMDIYLTNDTLGVAVIIENKLDALVDNPFESYAKHALSTYATTLSVILAPTLREATAESDAWTSAALTYDQLFDASRAGIDGDADPRSIDLLEQFIENTSARRTTMDAAAEHETLEEFWGAVRGSEQSFVEFFETLDRVNTILKSRARRLDAEISALFAERGVVLAESFVLAGVDRGWGRREGLTAVVYLGFRLPSGRGAELILGLIPGRRMHGLTIKAYDKDPNRPIPGFDHLPLGLDWTATDPEVAQAFVAKVAPILAGAV